MGSLGAQWYSRPEQADQQHGFADFYQRFFGETPSQKTPDTGLASIGVAKLGNAYTGQPPHKNRSSMLRSAYPPGGPPRFPEKAPSGNAWCFFSRVSMSAAVVALRRMSCSPMARAAFCNSANWHGIPPCVPNLGQHL
jgi:hypothetical protein